MITKVIAGGQTGVDRTALEVARALGVPTGGFAPKGWLTERGPDPGLAAFGLLEHRSPKYPPRTFANVKASDGTIWVGQGDSRGFKCTYRAVEQYGRPFLNNPDHVTLAQWADTYGIRVLNVAGPRASRDPDAMVRTRFLLEAVLRR